MRTWTFNDADQEFTVFSLRIAAERYDADARIASDASQPRLADQFSQQADRARTLAAIIENDDAS